MNNTSSTPTQINTSSTDAEYWLPFIERVQLELVNPLASKGVNLYDYEESIDQESIRLEFSADNHPELGSGEIAVMINLCNSNEPYDILWMSDDCRRRLRSTFNKAIWAFMYGTRASSDVAETREDPIAEIQALLEPILEDMETQLKLDVDGCDGSPESAYSALSTDELDLKVRWTLDVDPKTREADFTWELNTSVDHVNLRLASTYGDLLRATVELYNAKLKKQAL